MKRVGLISILLLVGIIFYGCNFEKAAEDATTTSQDFEFEMNPIAINGTSLVCIPAPSLDTLLSQLDEWEQIKDRIKKIELKHLDYKIPENTTPVDGQIKVYGGDNSGSVSQDPWGQTDIIAANTTYPDYEKVDLTSLGEDELGRYLNERDLSMVVCGMFSPETTSISLKIQLKLVIKVTLTAL